MKRIALSLLAVGALSFFSIEAKASDLSEVLHDVFGRHRHVAHHNHGVHPRALNRSLHHGIFPQFRRAPIGLYSTNRFGTNHGLNLGYGYDPGFGHGAGIGVGTGYIGGNYGCPSSGYEYGYGRPGVSVQLGF